MTYAFFQTGKAKLAEEMTSRRSKDGDLLTTHLLIIANSKFGLSTPLPPSALAVAQKQPWQSAIQQTHTQRTNHPGGIL